MTNKKEVLRNIGQLLVFFDSEMTCNAQKIDGMEVGDLELVYRQLLKTLSFLTGLSEEMIVKCMRK